MRKSIVLLLVLVTLAASIRIISIALAFSSGTDYSDQMGTLLFFMPEEYINYTITRVNGILWATIDGTYPMNLKTTSLDSLLMVYPTPPGTTNIHVTMEETELEWSNYTQAFPTALHHTAIGDWPMISCTIKPVPDDFVLKIHYEHPLETIDGNSLFLYDLNVAPYLSLESSTSIAYFTIRIEQNVTDLRAYTTQTDTTWNPITYKTSYENMTQVIALQIPSEYSKPLMGDLVVTFDDNTTPASPNWTITALLTAAVVVACAGIIVHYLGKRKRKTELEQQVLSHS